MAYFNFQETNWNTQMNNIHSQKILILDFGSQYTQLIARTRSRKPVCILKFIPGTSMLKRLRLITLRVLSYRVDPKTVTSNETPRAKDVVFELGVPVLGICYGMQTMAAQMGGKVESSEHKEFGYAQVKVVGDSALLKDIGDMQDGFDHAYLEVWMSHGDKVTQIPEGFNVIAASDNASRCCHEPRRKNVSMRCNFTLKSRIPNKAKPSCLALCMIFAVVNHYGLRAILLMMPSPK